MEGKKPGNAADERGRWVSGSDPLQGTGSEKFPLSGFIGSAALDKLFPFKSQSISFLTCKIKVILPTFLCRLWEFSEFVPIKPSTNEISSYLGASRDPRESAGSLWERFIETLCLSFSPS